ncbi:aminotransferase class I/II-fold pyridoxal phosphate-dependent enzyme [Mucilaginibacter sp. L3T2-6]|uniref:pyridoxal phosphate-dependent decarboxylase family protein n=1 Tax=Mucilaginibacter sp. L3T2-6 TaxID=3062491 RepID=UPI002676B76D|nr:aminotransferase class I/II-fold pyridoxal phosphate-dependent enzyme [Mucilaginibacter sp. L3T2-6]MDO3640819.1 aminotransferase class I/II-fold pyridoxal phosphate-dependent enzyme [Mucilaginibacter sp. L3T2-6]MDV6213705.1 aminotransferase class I/II-fold pyridoxal phosphate-dependent enzyme [Mucilaginibacter sp. L3T2-6]
MEDLLKRAYDATDFRNSGHRIIDLLAGQLGQSHEIEGCDAINHKSPERQLDYWKDDFNKPFIESPDTLFKNVINNSVNLHNPGYLAHQVSVPLPLTVLTAAVMSYMNNGMAVYEMGMAGNAIEKIVISHLTSKFGLGDDASGIVTSGGTLGNLTALLAARASVSNVWEDGANDSEKLAIMVSAEAHFSIDRAARIMGLGKNGIIKVPVNEKFQMRTEALEICYQNAVAAGLKIFCIIGCSCSTSTGAFDDLQAIADFAQQHQIWFHIDGAHGAPAIFSDKHKHLLNGADNADSIVLDFHKMMMAPSLSTAVLFKHQRHSAHTFSQEALYLYQDEQEYEWFNSGKYTFECTKPATILHTYAIMRHYGDELYRQNIDCLFGLAREFASLVKNRDGFELASEPQANIVCFRYRCGELTTAINKQVLQQLIAEGKFYIVSTSVKGQFYLRTSIMNPFTTIENLQLLLDKIKELACSLHLNPQLQH